MSVVCEYLVTMGRVARRRHAIFVFQSLILVTTLFTLSLWLKCNSSKVLPSRDTESHFERPSQRKNCRPQKNVVFIKTHKCGSSTISNIILRYGMRYGLDFALPVIDNGHLGWPESIRPEHVEPLPPGRVYNMVIHHCTYNETTFKRMMPRDAKYISVVREPFAQFSSALNYFFEEIGQLRFETNNRVREFLSNPQKYERKLSFKFASVPFGKRSITKNFMSTELGFEVRNSNNELKIQEFLSSVLENFDLVMVFEYFEESVILLRRLLCWTMYDVIHLGVNRRHTISGDARNKAAVSNRLREIHRYHSNVDYRLYHITNDSFWNKIAKEGPAFFDEVRHFRLVLKSVRKFCREKNHHILTVEQSRWNREFPVDLRECASMRKLPKKFTFDIGRLMNLPKYGTRPDG
ncbi:galactosylceramide sulfotransferase-like [Tubulanus polymorphus]|uniref:galactosylceramide sulfotransferase-like n=1 Tax=Tubulanus polymorphus TaxID=672921 RepID=UPI003DA3B42E